MAIALEVINFIVPVKLIHQKYPGGWEQCLKDHERLLDGRVWYDDHLFRDGAMSPTDMRLLVDEWIDLGFDPPEMRDEREVFKDFCIVETMFGGPALPCNWLEMSDDFFSAYLKGTEPGEVIGGWARRMERKNLLAEAVKTNKESK